MAGPSSTVGFFHRFFEPRRAAGRLKLVKCWQLFKSIWPRHRSSISITVSMGEFIFVLISIVLAVTANSSCPSFTSSVEEGRAVCPGEELTYNCTIFDNTSIVPATSWRGFCPNGPITIVHGSPSLESGVCGSFVVNATASDGGCHTSILTVTASPELNEKVIQCSYSNKSVGRATPKVTDVAVNVHKGKTVVTCFGLTEMAYCKVCYGNSSDSLIECAFSEIGRAEENVTVILELTDDEPLYYQIALQTMQNNCTLQTGNFSTGDYETSTTSLPIPEPTPSASEPSEPTSEPTPSATLFGSDTPDTSGSDQWNVYGIPTISTIGPLFMISFLVVVGIICGRRHCACKVGRRKTFEVNRGRNGDQNESESGQDDSSKVAMRDRDSQLPTHQGTRQSNDLETEESVAQGSDLKAQHETSFAALLGKEEEEEGKKSGRPESGQSGKSLKV